MSFSGMLNHRCDIYHIIMTSVSPGNGLPGSPSFSYPNEPDIADLPCHFNVKGSSLTIIQNAPNANLEAKIKLVVPDGTDIRVNDKIVDAITGYEYTAEVPRDVRGHHTFVMLHRSSIQEPL